MLSALGYFIESLTMSCGAYGNPPRHIAELFKQVIEEEEYEHYFRFIVFAIFDDHNASKAHNPSGNAQPFMDVFGRDDTQVFLETFQSKV